MTYEALRNKITKRVSDVRLPPIAMTLASGLWRKVVFFAPSPLRSWDERRRLRNQIRSRKRLVPVERLSATYHEALSLLMKRQGTVVWGDYLEFGVYDGTSLACMYRVLNQMGLDHVRLFGFDTFEGLPPENIDANSPWAAGEFRSDESFTRAVLADEGVVGDRVSLIRGKFSETLNEEFLANHSIQRCSLVMIDCDLYASARQALIFCAPLVKDNAVFVFDDWPADASGYQGENVAFEEFLATHPEFTSHRLEIDYSRNSAVFLVSRVQQ